MADQGLLHGMITRRRLLTTAAVAGAALSRPAWRQKMVDLPLPGDPDAQQITTALPQKGPMILQRTRPPLLETPFEVFDRGVFTPREVKKMINNYRAPIAPEDVGTIVEYLTTLNGAK